MGAFCLYPDECRPRQTKNSPLHRLLDSHYREFRDVYDERFSKRYGYQRPVTDEVVDKYLRCGDPHYGFARIRCRECGAEYLRAYSCKYRGFCPSCSKRKSLDLAVFLEKELFRPVPHRYWVWSLPRMLRLHFLHHQDEDSRKTLSEYISRAPFSLERMVFNENTDTVLYRGEHFHPGLARNFDVSDPGSFLRMRAQPEG